MYTQNELSKSIKMMQAEFNVKTVFSQNAKMKRSSQNGIHLYNWGIPALKSQDGTATCPMAGSCARGCYARQGAYVWSNVAAAYENRLKLSRSVNFETVIKFHIDRLLLKHKTGLIMIRVHDAGDFYNESYASRWFSIAMAYQNEPRVQFYAYTKMVAMFKGDLSAKRPKNFKIIFSLGGKQDDMIQSETDRHSKVFETETELNSQGYVNASHNDMDALGDNLKIGLVYHGTKGYAKTNWSKVK